VTSNVWLFLLQSCFEMKQLLALIILISTTCNLFGQSKNINSFIDSFAKRNDFNGSILISKKSGISYQKSFGLANFQFKVPNKNETKYKIASITKLFTSVLIMQLCEQGKIDLTKHIKDYLPEYSGEGGNKITIHQLLNHTSGMANIDTVKSMESALKNGLPVYQKPRTTEELLNEYCSDTLVNEPGKVFDYNNAEYIIFGKIIEKLYNKTYEQVVKENILQPLKMKNSGLLYQQNIIDGLADTYFYRDDIKKLVPDLPVYMENWYAAGSMYSTVNDLLQFTNALFGLKLLRLETLNRMFVPDLGEYGYGVWVHENYGINGKKFKIIKRPGQIMGAQGMLFHISGEGSTIIILSNTGTTSLDDFAAEIAKHLVL
jgi:CubicO group peptidase (beta-lactamase class C family)